jgi:aryl-alcohol dehydrogenase-like predicted oxidoreductase
LVLSTKIYWESIFTPKGQNSLGLSRKRVLGGLKESLKRLEVDNVDIVFAHRFDRDTPLEETCRAFDAAIN